MPFLAVPSSSLVECCCKHSVTFMLLSLVGGVLFFVHANVASEVVLQQAPDYGCPPVESFLAHIFLCDVNLSRRVPRLQDRDSNGRPMHPVESLTGTPLQVLTHPPVAA